MTMKTSNRKMFGSVRKCAEVFGSVRKCADLRKPNMANVRNRSLKDKGLPSKPNTEQDSTSTLQCSAVRTVLPPLLVATWLICAVVAHAAPLTVTGVVTRVSDGDTLRLTPNDGPPVMVRLLGIDAPERNQPHGPEALAVLEQLVAGEQVTVESANRDRYGRLVGEVLLPDGRRVTHEVVRLGSAWWSCEHARNDLRLRALEAEARVARRGLWAQDDPVPPWTWRRRP
jgi:endonuclease YncB( thermonuclease family)